jgi:hypothetical protein
MIVLGLRHQELGSANFSRIVITALVCAVMPIGLHCNNHIIHSYLRVTRGSYPSRAVYELILSLNQSSTIPSECKALSIIYKLKIMTDAKYTNPNNIIAVKISSNHIFIIYSLFVG